MNDGSTNTPAWDDVWNACPYLGTGILAAIPTLIASYYATKRIRTALPLHLPGRLGTVMLMAARCIPPILATSLGHLI